MNNKTSCHCCKKLYENHLILNCSVCGGNFGNACIGLTPSEIRVINSKKSISWSCRNCENIGDDIASLKAVIVSLQNEIKDLKSAVQAMPMAGNNALSDEMMEEIILEFEERQERKLNIILYGLPEQPATQSNSQNVILEAQTVNDMIHSLMPDIPTVDKSKIRRLGKFTQFDDKPRPVKITLNTAEDARNILISSRELRNSHNYSRLFVSADRTPKQREYYNKVKESLEQRKSNGENVVLKYMKGVPFIKSLN